MRGIERRIEAGLDPEVPRSPRCSSAAGTPRSPSGRPPSCATGSGSRSASAPTAPTASCSTRSAGERLANEGARPQRLLWASTGTKDPDASDVALHRGPGVAVHRQHDAREDAARVRRPRHGRRAAAGRRRRRRGDAAPPSPRPASTRRRSSPAQAAGREGAERFVASWSELLRRSPTEQRTTCRAVRPADASVAPCSEPLRERRGLARRSSATTPRSRAATCASCSPPTPTAASA